MEKIDKWFIVMLAGIFVGIIGASEVTSFVLQIIITALDLSPDIKYGTLDLILRVSIMSFGILLSLFSALIIKSKNPKKDDQ